MNQTLSNIEIICINDGSTDKSLEILETYAKLDSRINIFTFNNKGLGPSRNRGIERARGEYIAFVDTDDWIDLEFCEKIYEQAKKTQADIILFNAIEEYHDHQKERIYFPKWNINNYDNFTFDLKWEKNLLLNKFFTAWSKLHRTQFLLENNLRFPSTIFEDMEFQVESFLAAKKFSYNPNIFYHYRKENSSSIMNSLKEDECYCVINIVNNIKNHLYKFNAYEYYKYNFLNYNIRQFKEKFYSTKNMYKNEFYKIIKDYFENLSLDREDFIKLARDLVVFYKNVITSNDFFEFTRLEKNKIINYKTNSNLTMKSNILLLNENVYQNNPSNRKNEMMAKMQRDLINGNFINFKVYENMIDEELFDYDFYENQCEYENNNLDSLISYLYLDNCKINNPTNFFDNEFYLKQYNSIGNSKINPLIYYIAYGRFEGKDKINDNINSIRSINRRKLYKKIKNTESDYKLNENVRKQKLIISLTSFPERMNDIIYVLYSLFNQSIKPDEIILWLSYEQFPNLENDLSLDVLEFKKWGLKIEWCEDMKSYKKLIPSLKKYPKDIIVTADDDVYYQQDWLKILWEEHLKFPKDIIAHRARKITFNENKNMDSYNKWKISYEELDSSFLNFFTGVGGILYPPNSLHYDVLNKEVFEEICPFGDDIWFWAMAIKNNTKIKVPEKCIAYLIYINTLKELNIGNSLSLWHLNKAGGNDEQFKNLFKIYPEIYEKIFKSI